jgi:intraflagellar transport protein 80
VVYLFDSETGKQRPDTIKHTQEIIQISLNLSNNVGRQLLILDKNRDLYISNDLKQNFKKIGSMVESFAWNQSSDVLALISDSKIVFWLYPNGIFVDQDVFPIAKLEREASFGANAQILSFIGNNCRIKRSDGAIMSVGYLPPMCEMLQTMGKKKQWEKAMKLCRQMNQRELWASLALIAVYGHDLDTAEVAYAAIEQVHKVHFITNARALPSPEARAAELALLKRLPKEAESILLVANLVCRAIKMQAELFNWDR